MHIIVNEIKKYIDCRYVSPSEAYWRLFSFPIHGRNLVVERLFTISRVTILFTIPIMR